MPWKIRLRTLIGNTIGISFKDGTGTSGIFCGNSGNTLFVMEYLYQDQFAMKQYPFEMISDVNPFPPCRLQPAPTRHRAQLY